MSQELTHMGGPLDDVVSKTVSTAMEAVLGKPGSEGEKARVEFLSSVLSRTGEKFVASPTGKDAVNKTLFVAAVPAFLLGVLAGYLYFHRRKA